MGQVTIMSIKIIQNCQPAKYHEYPLNPNWKNAYPVMCDLTNIIHCRIGGMTFRQMESVLGIPKSTCHRLWWKQLTAINHQQDIEALGRRLLTMRGLEVERWEIERASRLFVIYPRPRFSKNRRCLHFKERKKKLEEDEACFNCGPAGKYRVEYRKPRPYQITLELWNREYDDKPYKHRRIYTVRWADLFPKHKRR